jgi:hypothetical protein
LNADELRSLADSLDGIDPVKRSRARDLIADPDGAGAELVDGFDGETLDTFLGVEAGTADMRAWRRGVSRALSRSGTNGQANIDTEDIREYTAALDEIDGSERISNPEALVDEVADNPTPSQLVGQTLEAKRAAYYARNGNDVTVEPPEGTADLKIEAPSGGDPTYVETKNVEGDLDGGLTVKDQVRDADGSFDDISGSHDEVVEIGAQDDVPTDFNPNTPDADTPRESFKDLIRAARQPGSDLRLPERLGGYDNPDMTVRVVDENGNVVGEEFSLREVYREVNNENGG